MTPLRGPTLIATSQRLLVLEATGRETDDAYVADGRAHEVVAVALWRQRGELVVSPVIVCDGDLMTLDHARHNVWTESTVDEVVACTWPRHCDEAMVGKILDRLQDEAVERLRERAGGRQPKKSLGTTPAPDPPEAPPLFGDN